MSLQSQDVRPAETLVVLLNAALLIHGGTSKLEQNVSLLRFLKENGVEVILYTTDHQVRTLESIIARLDIPLEDMAEIIRHDPARHYWVVDEKRGNLMLAKKLSGKIKTVMVEGGSTSVTGGTDEVDIFISDLNRLIALIFPQKI